MANGTVKPQRRDGRRDGELQISYFGFQKGVGRIGRIGQIGRLGLAYVCLRIECKLRSKAKDWILMSGVGSGVGGSESAVRRRSKVSFMSDFSKAPDLRPRARAFGLAGMATALTSSNSCSRYFLL